MDITFRNKQRKKDRANAERMAKKAMDKLITRKEAASILGISVKTLDAARTDGLISYVQMWKTAAFISRKWGFRSTLQNVRTVQNRWNVLRHIANLEAFGGENRHR